MIKWLSLNPITSKMLYIIVITASTTCIARVRFTLMWRRSSPTTCLLSEKWVYCMHVILNIKSNTSRLIINAHIYYTYWIFNLLLFIYTYWIFNLLLFIFFRFLQYFPDNLRWWNVKRKQKVDREDYSFDSFTYVFTLSS